MEDNSLFRLVKRERQLLNEYGNNARIAVIPIGNTIESITNSRENGYEGVND